MDLIGGGGGVNCHFHTTGVKFLVFLKNAVPNCTENKKLKECYFLLVLGSLSTYTVLLSCPPIKNQYFCYHNNDLGKTKERNAKFHKEILIFKQF